MKNIVLPCFSANKIAILALALMHFSQISANCERERSLFPRRFSSLQNESLVHEQRRRVDKVLNSIVIKYYKNGTKPVEKLANQRENLLRNTGCNAEDKFAFILHGWIQSCDDDWVTRLIERLSYYRRGCIICIDYSSIANGSYMKLYSNFKYLVRAIVSILHSLMDDGLDPDRSFMFGFSFGGQLASAVGRTLSQNQMFKHIDTCDMAGPGFDAVQIDHHKAAKHVQCFHSSRDKGTGIYSCHRNVILGNCGYNQPAAISQPHLGSHGLCLNIYINAFDYPFYALRAPPKECHDIATDLAKKVPQKYTVGYEENFNTDIIGKIFVPTSLNYPYNLSKRELALKYRKLM